MANNWNERNRFNSDNDRPERSGRYDERRMGYDSAPFEDRSSEYDRGLESSSMYSPSGRSRMGQDSSREMGRDNRDLRDFGRSYGHDANRDMGRDMRDMRQSWEESDWGHSRMSRDHGRNFDNDYRRGSEREDYDQLGGYGSGYRTGADFGSYGRDDQMSQRREMGIGYGSSYGRNDDNRLYSSDFGYRTGGMSGGRQQDRQQDRQQERQGMYHGRGPKGWKRSDDRIKEDVSELLERHPYIDASEIEIDVKEGLVTLRGSVEDRRQKRLAEDSIESMAGVKDIRNELNVNASLFERAKDAVREAFGASERTDAKAGQRTSSKH